jgi:hypothetical protein
MIGRDFEPGSPAAQRIRDVRLLRLLFVRLPGLFIGSALELYFDRFVPDTFILIDAPDNFLLWSAAERLARSKRRTGCQASADFQISTFLHDR